MLQPLNEPFGLADVPGGQRDPGGLDDRGALPRFDERVAGGGRGDPDQQVSSLIWNRSRTTPPKHIAPIRPLPSGSASVHS